jgi:hypothetical protein
MGTHKSSFQQKVVWLIEHVEIWHGWPGDTGMDGRIKRAMHKDGLISTYTHCAIDFRKLIAEAREQIRKSKYKHED